MQELNSFLFPSLEIPTAAPILVLASASPRRADLLRTLGVPFVVAASDVPEPRPTADDESQPANFVEKLARFKAENCDETQFADGSDARVVVLAADTIVWHEGTILNKPKDKDDARAMLRRLRGKTHTVYTGVCLRMGDHFCIGHEATLVQFGHASDYWIDAYVETGEPSDKAGAYAAQGKGAVLIERIAGDFWNVVGLPLWKLSRMFEQIGMPLEDWWQQKDNATSA